MSNSLNITIEIKAPELSQAIMCLAEAMLGVKTQSTVVNQTVVQPPTASKKPSDKVVGDALAAQVIEETRAKMAAEKATQEPVATEVSEESAEAPEEETRQYSFEEIRKAIGDLSKAKGNAVARQLLSDLGEKCVTDLAPGSYAEVMRRVKELS